MQVCIDVVVAPKVSPRKELGIEWVGFGNMLVLEDKGYGRRKLGHDITNVDDTPGDQRKGMKYCLNSLFSTFGEARWY